MQWLAIDTESGHRGAKVFKKFCHEREKHNIPEMPYQVPCKVDRGRQVSVFYQWVTSFLSICLPGGPALKEGLVCAPLYHHSYEHC